MRKLWIWKKKVKLSKYDVTIKIVDTAYVQVEAADEEEAEERAYEALVNGDAEIENQYDDPELEFEIEKIEKETDGN